MRRTLRSSWGILTRDVFLYAKLNGKSTNYHYFRFLNILVSHNLVNSIKHHHVYFFEKTWNKKTRIDGIILLPECITVLTEPSIVPNLTGHVAVIQKFNRGFLKNIKNLNAKLSVFTRHH